MHRGEHYLELEKYFASLEEKSKLWKHDVEARLCVAKWKHDSEQRFIDWDGMSPAGARARATKIVRENPGVFHLSCWL